MTSHTPPAADSALTKRPRYSDPLENLYDNIVITESGCWEWQRYRNPLGYGSMSLFGQHWSTHRASLVLHGIDMIEGLCVDHLCRNTSCCNPEHLEQVTPLENTRRGITGEVNRQRMLSKTECANGHPYVEGSYAMKPSGERRCKECHNTETRRYYANHRSEVLQRLVTKRRKYGRTS